MPTPARRDPESSFNEDSPAGIAVNALLMAANAMDVTKKPKDDEDGSAQQPPEKNDSASVASEEETEEHFEPAPKTPAEARRSGSVETKTNDSASDQQQPQKTAEVSPDDRFNSRKRSMASETPSKGTPNLAFIKKKARPLPTSASKKLERNVSSDESMPSPLGKTQQSLKTSTIQELL